MRKNVVVHFVGGTKREFGDVAWNWSEHEAYFVIMRYFGDRSLPVAFIPRESIETVDIEWEV